MTNLVVVVRRRGLPPQVDQRGIASLPISMRALIAIRRLASKRAQDEQMNEEASAHTVAVQSKLPVSCRRFDERLDDLASEALRLAVSRHAQSWLSPNSAEIAHAVDSLVTEDGCPFFIHGGNYASN